MLLTAGTLAPKLYNNLGKFTRSCPDIYVWGKQLPVYYPRLAEVARQSCLVRFSQQLE